MLMTSATAMPHRSRRPGPGVSPTASRATAIHAKYQDHYPKCLRPVEAVSKRRLRPGNCSDSCTNRDSSPEMRPAGPLPDAALRCGLSPWTRLSGKRCFWLSLIAVREDPTWVGRFAQYVAKKLAAFSGLYPRRSESLVVPGSRCPAAVCTSSSWAPFSSAVVMKVARIECAE